MRTRKEIESEMTAAAGGGTLADRAQRSLQLEVLLDIRELLQTRVEQEEKWEKRASAREQARARK